MKVTGAGSPAGRPQDLPAGVLQTLSLLHRRWAPHLIYLLGQGPARFCELQHSIPGITATSLSGRLQALISEGLVTRQVCPGPPLGSRYAVTPQGHSLAEGLNRLLADQPTGRQPARSALPRHQTDHSPNSTPTTQHDPNAPPVEKGDIRDLNTQQPRPGQ